VYIPAAFNEDRLEIQHALIRQHPLGLLAVHGPDGLDASPVPFVLDAQAGPHGTLQCHLARANPILAMLASAEQCLVTFMGPQAYVSPSWYATKAETGKVVPTWNYAAVQAWGKPRVMDDAQWLRRQVATLTEAQESAMPRPWAVDDAPADYLAAMLRGIVGVEIPIARIAGKWKTSQNQPEANRAGVVRGLMEQPPCAHAMAELVRQRG